MSEGGQPPFTYVLYSVYCIYDVQLIILHYTFHTIITMYNHLVLHLFTINLSSTAELEGLSR